MCFINETSNIMLFSSVIMLCQINMAFCRDGAWKLQSQVCILPTSEGAENELDQKVIGLSHLFQFQAIILWSPGAVLTIQCSPELDMQSFKHTQY